MKSGFIFLKSAQMIDMFDSNAHIGKISTFPTICSPVCLHMGVGPWWKYARYRLVSVSGVGGSCNTIFLQVSTHDAVSWYYDPPGLDTETLGI